LLPLFDCFSALLVTFTAYLHILQIHHECPVCPYSTLIPHTPKQHKTDVFFFPSRFVSESKWGADGRSGGTAIAPTLRFVFNTQTRRLLGDMNDVAVASKRGHELGGGGKRRRVSASARDGDGDGDASDGNDARMDDTSIAQHFPGLRFAISRLPPGGVGSAAVAADVYDASAAARETRRVLEELAEKSKSGNGESGSDRDSRNESFAALRDATRRVRPLVATTAGGDTEVRSLSLDTDAEVWKQVLVEVLGCGDESRDGAEVAFPGKISQNSIHKIEKSRNDAGFALRRRFGGFDDADWDGKKVPTNCPVVTGLLETSLAQTPFFEMTHPEGALNVRSYATKRDDAKRSERDLRDENGLVSTSESGVESSASVSLELCLNRNDVCVSLGVSTLDCVFTTLAAAAAAGCDGDGGDDRDGSPRLDTHTREGDDSDPRLDTMNRSYHDDDTNTRGALRRWTVFKREDSHVLSRWLALRGGGCLDTPCLAFELQRETKETAAALAAAARAARAMCSAYPTDTDLADEHAEAVLLADEARGAAERAAAAAFDAVRLVSPKETASALRRRDTAHVLDTTALEDLRRDVGVTPGWVVTQKMGETFFVPAGCPRFAVAITPHVAARWFFLSPASVSSALRATNAQRFLPTGHAERGDPLGVRAAVTFAAHLMEKELGAQIVTKENENGTAPLVGTSGNGFGKQPAEGREENRVENPNVA
jgi:hypothetical protein